MYEINEYHYPRLSPLSTGLHCRCPRCGEGRVFHHLLRVRPECSICGLDLSAANGSGWPAVIAVIMAGIVVVLVLLVAGAALAYEPPLWVHLLLGLPAMVILCLLLLRPVKATLLALRHERREREGRAHG